MVETAPQRVLIEGAYQDKQGVLFEARGRIKLPADATELRIERAHLALRGFWHDKGYQSFGLMPIPINKYEPEIQPEFDDDPNIIYQMRPRTLLLEDQKVFQRWLPMGWGPGDPDNAPELEYEKRFLSGDSFDFEAMWERVGSSLAKGIVI